jgi:hypothetical protein
MAGGSAQSTTTAAIGPVSDRLRLQHVELVALRVGEDRPRDVALAHVGGRCAEFLKARDEVRLMGGGGRGEIDVYAVLHRFGLRVGNDIDADGGGVGVDEALGLEVGHAGCLAGNTPVERLRPEPAERRVIPSLHMNLNKSRRHAADPRPMTFGSALSACPADCAGPDPRDRP